MIFGGEFRQILPVVCHGTRVDKVNATMNRSYLWKNIVVMHLRKNIRVLHLNKNAFEQTSFAEYLVRYDY